MPKALPQGDYRAPFTRMVGLKLDGYSRCILETRQELLNVYGNVHGGAIYVMADVGMGQALYEHLDEDELCSTIEIKIGYVAPATSGVLCCESRLIHKTRRLAFMESTITNGDILTAKATGTFYLFKAKGNGV